MYFYRALREDENVTEGVFAKVSTNYMSEREKIQESNAQVLHGNRIGTAFISASTSFEVCYKFASEIHEFSKNMQSNIIAINKDSLEKYDKNYDKKYFNMTERKSRVGNYAKKAEEIVIFRNIDKEDYVELPLLVCDVLFEIKDNAKREKYIDEIYENKKLNDKLSSIDKAILKAMDKLSSIEIAFIYLYYVNRIPCFQLKAIFEENSIQFDDIRKRIIDKIRCELSGNKLLSSNSTPDASKISIDSEVLKDSISIFTKFKPEDCLASKIKKQIKKKYNNIKEDIVNKNKQTIYSENKKFLSIFNNPNKEISLDGVENLYIGPNVDNLTFKDCANIKYVWFSSKNNELFDLFSDFKQLKFFYVKDTNGDYIENNDIYYMIMKKHSSYCPDFLQKQLMSAISNYKGIEVLYSNDNNKVIISKITVLIQEDNEKISVCLQKIYKKVKSFIESMNKYQLNSNNYFSIAYIYIEYRNMYETHAFSLRCKDLKDMDIDHLDKYIKIDENSVYDLQDNSNRMIFYNYKSDIKKIFKEYCKNNTEELNLWLIKEFIRLFVHTEDINSIPKLVSDEEETKSMIKDKISSLVDSIFSEINNNKQNK